MSERIWIRKKDWHIEHFNPHNSGYQTWMLASESYQTLQSEREAREDERQRCEVYETRTFTAEQRVAELERERQRDALDGQAALDEANNAVAAARTAALEEAAQTCIDLWKNATNVRHKVMRLDHVQNAISHGCIASAAAIRAKKGRE